MKVKKRCKYGQHAAVKFVIDGEFFAEEIYADYQENKQQPSANDTEGVGFFFKGTLFRKLQRVNYQRGKGKSNQNPEINRGGVEDEIYQLTYCAQAEHKKEMFPFVLGISTAFGDGKGEQGHGNSTKDTP